MKPVKGMAKTGKTQNLVRSSIVPETIAIDTAQKTNSKNHFAAAGTVEPSSDGVSMCEPGRNWGRNPVWPMIWPRNPSAKPKAMAKPQSQYMIDETLRLTSTLATTVPTFFIREKPTSSMAKPACMKSTRTAATMTHTVSAATPAAWVAVLSVSA
jgi:hypothetical protein